MVSCYGQRIPGFKLVQSPGWADAIPGFAPPPSAAFSPVRFPLFYQTCSRPQCLPRSHLCTIIPSCPQEGSQQKLTLDLVAARLTLGVSLRTRMAGIFCQTCRCPRRCSRSHLCTIIPSCPQEGGQQELALDLIAARLTLRASLWTRVADSSVLRRRRSSLSRRCRASLGTPSVAPTHHSRAQMSSWGQ